MTKAPKDGPDKRENKKLDRDLRRSGVDPNQALCTECGTWYDVTVDAQVNRHAH